MYERRDAYYEGIDRDTEALIDEFCSQAEVSESTRHKYRMHLTELARWLNHPRVSRADERRTLLNVNPADVSRFMAYLRSPDRFAGHQHHKVKGDLAPSSRKNALSSIRSFYRYLVAVQILKIDPSYAVRPPRVIKTPGVHLTAEELRKMLDAPGSPREKITTYLLAYTGARADEIRWLRWSSVDFNERTLTVLGKGGKYRVIDIHGALMAELRRWQLYIEDLANRKPALREALEDPERNYVLITPSGLPIGNNSIRRHIKARARRIGLRPRDCHGGTDVSPHALRRTFATLLLNDGHHIDAVADVLGHVNIDTTRQHYAFASTARRRATIRSFNV